MPRRAALLTACLLLAAGFGSAARAQSPVGFDRYSQTVGGKRVFLTSGEVHPFRMPSPAFWPDVLGRMKASGLNTVSIYVPWQLHEPAPGRFRFDGRYDLERFLALARDAGLYVVVRPGPYIQGEIDAGGFPAWLLGRPGVLRTLDPPYTAAWKRWYAEVMPRIARWQVGGASRGSVIGVQVENEFPGGADPGQQGTEEARAYMRDLVATAKGHGITVPVTHNDVQYLGMQISRGRYVDLVDNFSFDNYPYGFRCCPEYGTDTFAQVDTFEQYYRDRGVTTSPLYTAEVQGGIAPIAGDDGADPEARHRRLVGYEGVQGLSLIAQGLTHINRYMTYGGTTWGYLPYPTLGTSYDYAAPIREWGGLGARYDDLRRVNLQIAAAGQTITATEAVSGAVESSDPDALYRVRRARSGGALHVFLRNADAGPDRAPVLTIGGRRTLPVPLPGHSARWLVAGAKLGAFRVDLTTAEVAFADRRTLALFGDRGHRYEAVIAGRRVRFTPGARPRVRRLPRGKRLLMLSRESAARLWPKGRRIYVGPSLVTERTMESDRPGRGLLLEGRRVRGLRLGAPPRRLRLPALRDWRYQPDAPEREPGFDDSSWTVADRATTHNQMQPLTSPVLGADDYGVPSAGYVWYRGRFTGPANGICLEGRHRYHAWLNGRSLGTVTSDAEVPGPGGLGGLGAAPPENQATTLPFPAGAAGTGENVVSVLVESWGHVMDAGAANQAKQTRGLVSASLDRLGSPPCGFALGVGGETTQPLGGGSPTTLPSLPKPDGGITWRLQGGDPSDYPNTSGLFGERAGYWRERFDDRSWTPVSLPHHDARLGPGEVGWYRSEFKLRVPRGVRAPLGLELPRGSHPAEVFLNGVHVARAGRDRLERFVLPPGVLRPRGRNTLAIARWNVAGQTRSDRPRLVPYEMVRTSRLRR